MADTHFTPFTPEQVARFWAKVGPPDANGCRPWLACRDKRLGYGYFAHGGRPIGAHRLAWILTYGPAWPGAVFRHSCDNRTCCEPTHITPGTQAENIADAVAKGRMSRGPRPAARHPKPAGFGETRRGEKNASAKLTADDVEAIRKARTDGRTLQSIAVEFGVTTTTVWRICSNAPHGGWAWLDGSHR